MTEHIKKKKDIQKYRLHFNDSPAWNVKIVRRNIIKGVAEDKITALDLSFLSSQDNCMIVSLNIIGSAFFCQNKLL